MAKNEATRLKFFRPHGARKTSNWPRETLLACVLAEREIAGEMFWPEKQKLLWEH